MISRAMWRLLPLATALVVLGTADIALAADPGDYSVVAHRGQRFNPVITENTVAAGIEGMRQGATSVEIDIMPTRDLKFVVMHDRHLGRTTTCRGAVKHRTLRSIQRNCRGDHGERIPSLTNYLDWARQAQANLLLEIKFNGIVWNDALVDAAIRRVEATGMSGRVRFASYDVRALNRIEQTRPAFKTMVFKPAAQTALDLVAATPLVDQVALCAVDQTPEVIDLLAAQGRSVQGGVTDAAQNWEFFRAHGVDEVMVNHVDNYVRWRDTGAVSWTPESGPCAALTS